MLIVNNSDVQYCFVKRKVSGKEKILSALTYRGVLFVKFKSYAKSQLKKAMRRCRKFLDKRPIATSILVRGSREVTLWLSDDLVNLAGHRNNSLVTQPEEAALDSEFIKYCCQELTKTIGPIANLICQEILGQNPQINKIALIEALAKQIPDSQQAVKFQSRLINLILQDTISTETEPKHSQKIRIKKSRSLKKYRGVVYQ